MKEPKEGKNYEECSRDTEVAQWVKVPDAKVTTSRSHMAEGES